MMSNKKFHLDLLVISPGGVCHTYFMKKIISNTPSINHIGDLDGLKHIPSYEKIPDDLGVKKCIYIYGDPLRSILSHFKRGWPAVQMKKIGKDFLGSLKQHPFNGSIKRPRKDIFDIDQNFYHLNKLYPSDFIERTMKEGKDLFGVKQHFYNWYNMKDALPFPIMFIDIRDIENLGTELSHFTGINRKVFEGMKYRDNMRDSTELLKNIPGEVKEIYRNIDEDITKRIKELKLQYTLSKMVT